MNKDAAERRDRRRQRVAREVVDNYDSIFLSHPRHPYFNNNANIIDLDHEGFASPSDIIEDPPISGFDPSSPKVNDRWYVMSTPIKEDKNRLAVSFREYAKQFKNSRSKVVLPPPVGTRKLILPRRYKFDTSSDESDIPSKSLKPPKPLINLNPPVRTRKLIFPRRIHFTSSFDESELPSKPLEPLEPNNQPPINPIPPVRTRKLIFPRRFNFASSSGGLNSSNSFPKSSQLCDKMLLLDQPMPSATPLTEQSKPHFMHNFRKKILPSNFIRK